MRKKPIPDIREIATQFELGGTFISADRYGRGHINDTYLVVVGSGGTNARFILQRINEHVFREPALVMDNIQRILKHLQSKSDDPRASLSLVPGRDGRPFYRDADGGYWRAYRFIENACTCDEVAITTQASEAAAMFGRFQNLVSDLPGPRLHETIPDFHNTPARYRQFHQILERDAHDRVRHCAAEIDCALAYEEAAGALQALQDAGEIPERIAHNDTKLNNVMFDVHSDKAICVIDLDTVMPGSVLYDFGDLVRTASTPTAEDETDLSRVRMRMDYYEALVEGYLSAAMDFLTETEVGNLSMAGKVITIEAGVRFLTDYLSGDEYFRIYRADQNLDRCRTQFALAASIDGQFDKMLKVVGSVAYRSGS